MLIVRRFLLLVIVWAAHFSMVAAARTPELVPQIQISLFNDARLSPAVLSQAKDRASAIFHQAGLELAWLDCPPADPLDFVSAPSSCSNVSWPHHLSVRIINQGHTISAETFGQAFLDESGSGVYSNVYFQNLAAGPNRAELGEGDMLGYVIAHELGHLLLGSRSHSDSGLMQARWTSPTLQAASRSALFFTPSQATALRSRLSNCDAASPSSRTFRPALPTIRLIRARVGTEL